MSDKLKAERIKKRVSNIEDSISHGDMSAHAVFTAMRTAYMPAMASLESNRQAVRELVEGLESITNLYVGLIKSCGETFPEEDAGVADARTLIAKHSKEER